MTGWRALTIACGLLPRNPRKRSFKPCLVVRLSAPTMPKSTNATVGVVLLGPGITKILPGCGSAWKKPISKNW